MSMTETLQYPLLPHTSEAHEREQAHCAACPKLCRHTCPVADAEKRETVTPWGLMNALHFEGMGPRDSDVGELSYHCTGCRACQGFCKFHQDVPGALHTRRAEAFEHGEAPTTAKSLVAKFRSNGDNLYSRHLLDVVKEQVPEHLLRPDAKERIWIDCVTAARYPSLIRDIADIVALLDIPQVGFYIDEPGCCGLPLYDAGDLPGFLTHAKSVMAALGNCRRIYQLSPGCTHALRDVYRSLELSWDVEILPLIELLLPYLPGVQTAVAPPPPNTSGGETSSHAASNVPAPNEQGITGDATHLQGAYVYLAPCHLTRALGQNSAPEAWIRAVTDGPLRRARDEGTSTPCSGAGGSLPALLPETANAVTTRCLEQVNLAAGETLVVACSSSHRRLQTQTDAPIIHLFSLIAQHLRAHTPPRGGST